MAEPTLSLTYTDLARRLAQQIGFGSVYSTGTIEIASGVITLTGGSFPTWLSSGTTTGTGTSVIIVDTGDIYAVDFRSSATAATLVDTSVTVAAGKSYLVMQSVSDDPVNTGRIVQDAIDEGYRRLCYPPVPGEEGFYLWTWLMEQGSFSLTASDADLDLPDNWGGFIEDSLVYSSGARQTNIEIISQRELRSYQADDTAEGVPEYVSVRPKAFVATTGRRYEALFYPTPDASYTVTYLYRVVPDRLSPANLYPICGAQYSEALMAACQFAVEQTTDEEVSVYQAKWQELLAASISADQAAKRSMGIG